MAPTPDPPGGLGGIPEIDERTPGRDLKLIRTAVRNRWIVPEDGFETLPKAMLGIALDEERDDRARVSAAKVLTTMHGQNEEQDAPAGAGVQVNVSIEPGITIVRQRDFYGNDAHERVTETVPARAIAAPAAGPEEPGPVQNADLRPAVGKNVNGTNGHAGGARPDTRGQNGRH